MNEHDDFMRELRETTTRRELREVQKLIDAPPGPLTQRLMSGCDPDDEVRAFRGFVHGALWGSLLWLAVGVIVAIVLAHAR